MMKIKNYNQIFMIINVKSEGAGRVTVTPVYIFDQLRYSFKLKG